MEYKNIIIGIFCFIGVVVVALLISASYSKKVKKDAKYLAESWPPPKYMETIGSKCPDYWEFVGTREESVRGQVPIVYNKCRNTFNIPSGTDKYNSGPDGCYNPATNIYEFKQSETQWPIVNKNFNNSKTCKWIRNCGPISNTNAAWLGYADKC